MKLWPLTVSFIDDYAEATEVHCCLWRSTLPPWSRCSASLHRKYPDCPGSIKMFEASVSS